MTPRLNINLKEEDEKALEKLRRYYEDKNNGKKLSYAEVVRRAIHYTLYIVD